MKTIYTIIGASGSGKSTLGQYLKENGVQEIVSHTTREKRVGEVNGETYYYISKEEIKELEKIEYAEYAGNCYALSKKEVDDKLNLCDKLFVIVDRVGVEELKKIYGDIIKVVYIKTDLATMESHMRKRGDSDSKIKSRLQYCESNNELNFDNYDYLIDNRGNIETSIEKLHSFVFGQNN